MWVFIVLSGFGGEGRVFLGFGVFDFLYGLVYLDVYWCIRFCWVGVFWFYGGVGWMGVGWFRV